MKIAYIYFTRLAGVSRLVFVFRMADGSFWAVSGGEA